MDNKEKYEIDLLISQKKKVDAEIEKIQQKPSIIEKSSAISSLVFGFLGLITAGTATIDALKSRGELKTIGEERTLLENENKKISAEINERNKTIAELKQSEALLTKTKKELKDSIDNLNRQRNAILKSGNKHTIPAAIEKAIDEAVNIERSISVQQDENKSNIDPSIEKQFN